PPNPQARPPRRSDERRRRRRSQAQDRGLESEHDREHRAERGAAGNTDDERIGQRVPEETLEADARRAERRPDQERENSPRKPVVEQDLPPERAGRNSA